MHKLLPKLVTFDGEARSGKGTVVSLVKDYLRDECGRKVMFIDSGQIFRVLGVAITQAGIDIDSPMAIDRYLTEDDNLSACVALVKKVYRMPKKERDALIYTLEAGVNSAKVGSRPRSQAFKDVLLRKWLKDARAEGFDTVLLDGRALEETGEMLEQYGLCEYVLGIFFVCDPVVSAQRTLGLVPGPLRELSKADKKAVREIVQQIEARNKADSIRAVQPVKKPVGAPKYLVNEVPEHLPRSNGRPMVIIDRSPELPLDVMALPTSRMIAQHLLT